MFRSWPVIWNDSIANPFWFVASSKAFTPSPLVGITSILYFTEIWAAAVVGLFHTSRLTESKTATVNNSSYVKESFLMDFALPSTIILLLGSTTIEDRTRMPKDRSCGALVRDKSLWFQRE